MAIAFAGSAVRAAYAAVPSGGFFKLAGEGYPTFVAAAGSGTAGAIQFAGTAAALGIGVTPAGGMAFAGAAPFGIHQATMSGNIHFAGAADYARAAIGSGGGGMVRFAGEGAATVAATPAAATGVGVQFAGNAPEGTFQTAEGAFSLGGTAATMSGVPHVAPSGPISLAGSAVVGFYAVSSTSGGGLGFSGAGYTYPTRSHVLPDSLGGGTHRGASDLATVLLAIQLKLINDELYAEENVWIKREQEIQDEAYAGDSYAVIVEPSERVDQAYFAGGGHKLDMRRVDVELRVYGRLNVDQYRRGTILVTDADRGLVRRARLVAKALQGIDLAYPNDAGAYVIIVSEPIRAVTIPIVQRPTRGRDNGMGYVSIRLDILYREDVEAVEDDP